MYLERIFLQAPDKIAVCQGEIRYSYGQLYAEAQRLAVFLKQGHGPLLVYGHKHPRMIVSLLACLLCGRAWVPCDSSLPSERIRKIIELCGAEQLFFAEEHIDGGNQRGNDGDQELAKGHAIVQNRRNSGSYKVGDFRDDSLIADCKIVQKGRVDFEMVDKVHKKDVEIGQIALQIVKQVEHALKSLR